MLTVPGTETVPANKIANVLRQREELLAILADATNPVVFDYQPGNGTRYQLVFQALPAITDIEGITPAQFRQSDSWLVSLVNFGCCAILSTQSYPEYVAEKLQLRIADATAISFLLRGRV